jgi:ferredoxin-NADP reductase
VSFVAGGIGITALLPMVKAAAAAGVRWRLTYIGRDAPTMPFVEELGDIPGGDVRVMQGRPDVEEILAGTSSATSVYLCGPATLLDAVRDALVVRPHAGFHFERFAPPPILDGAPFTVQLERSGRTVSVAADQSALAALREVEPGTPYSCQQGFCGTCRVEVREGDVERRGSAPFLDGPGTMLVCVDRADGTVVIDR